MHARSSCLCKIQLPCSTPARTRAACINAAKTVRPQRRQNPLAVPRGSQLGPRFHQDLASPSTLPLRQRGNNLRDNTGAMPRLSQVRQEHRILDNRTREPEPVQGASVLHCCFNNADSRWAPSNGPYVLLNGPQTAVLLLRSAELQQVLDCKVAKEVAAERNGILQQGLREIPDLRCFTLRQQLLDNPDTIAVCRNIFRRVVLRDLVDHELQGCCWHRANDLL
mmetsp:Transcript_108232/g.279893  ORF Transcript_108232/g.279893 Transcript_108232/m.279893 type:complete len:223 (+) Transcript_108232:298-966(+)